MKTMTPPQRKRFQRVVKRLDYADTANLLRELVENRHDDPRAMRILAEHAWSTAPNDLTAEIMRKLWTAFAAGRRVRFGTGRVTSVDGVDVRIIDEINTVFEEGEQT